MRYLFIVLLFITSVTTKAQDFCGFKHRSIDDIKKINQYQFDFLNISEGDTIVDVGAGSGWYEGMYSAIGSFKHVHFVLVDIDSSCLNRDKVNNMIAYYSEVKGEPITNTFQLVVNNESSLCLPDNSYNKVWIFNTLHEVDDAAATIRQLYKLLRPGGELVLLELNPARENKIHQGCHKPLATTMQWTSRFTQAGFILKDQVIRKIKRKISVQMLRFVK